MTDPPDELQSRLIDLVHSSLTLMRVLRAARAVDAPDWLIGAGVIRDLVWDRLHGFEGRRREKDIDLSFFDPSSLGDEGERDVQRELTARAPDICWDATNQAGVHLWYPRVFGVEVRPLASSADAVGTWPETATAVAIRLLAGDRIEVVAPYGLHDLFGLICRRNPRRATEQEYRRRVQSKHIAKRWPQVRIFDAPDQATL